MTRNMEVQNRAGTGSAERFDQAVSTLCQNLRGLLQAVPLTARRSAQEIRLRLGAPVALTCPGQIWFLGADGELHNLPHQLSYLVRRSDLEDSIVTMCSHSVHAHQQEMRNGFISLKGGHRAGICGTAVLGGDSAISALRDITSINLRIAREVRGAADTLVRDVFSKRLCGLLVAGPPSSGKTTVLRDLARQLSCGKAGRFYRVAVVDERCEIGAVYEGAPQNYLGPCCDILSGYPKREGISAAIRTLSPQVIVCDEIGGPEEADSILDGLQCGVKVVASAHAGSIGELLRRPGIRRLLERGAFERIVLLGGGDASGREDLPGRIVDMMEVGDLIDETDRGGAYRTMLIDDGCFHGVRLVPKSEGD